jgi:feruloyl esterase
MNRLLARVLVSLFAAGELALSTSLATAQGEPPATPSWSAPAACAGLMKQSFLDIPDAATSLLSATVVPATDTLPAYCHVVGTIAPQVGFDVGLPTAHWNGRLLMQGCGGTCGVHAISGCEDMLARDFAVVHTDMGHGGRPIVGALWAKDNLPGVIDFGYRATHVTIVAARAILQAFYGRPAAYTYFRGCSTGGRQAMVEAQRFPEDFDGIVAIAPPLDETGDAVMHLAWTTRAATQRDGRRVIAAADVRRVHAAAMAACDGLDGVRDGVIGDPSACEWTVAQLRCAPGQAQAGDGRPCLSDEKVEAFQRIYDGVRDSRGRRLYPGGMALGSELTWFDYFVSPNSEPAHLLDPNWLMGDFFRYLAFWDSPGAFGVYDIDYDRDPVRLGLREAIYTATNPDLRRFKARSGKLILVGGMDDPLIPMPTLIDYYQTVTRLMGGPGQTRDFFRMFLVPGMEHCVGGVGPDAIDYMSAIQAWVEHGTAPDSMTGAHLPKPQSMLRYARHPLPAGAAQWTRPVYAYPDSAVYTGSGDWHDAANWRGVLAVPATGDAP